MKKIRSDFPIFQNHKSLIYFDNAATTQKPKQVIDSLVAFYSKHNANVHRGIYHLSENATTLFNNARVKVAAFINANVNEIVFTKGTTESINLVALSWAEKNIVAGEAIITSQMEHFSNLIPWQQLAKKKGVLLLIVPIKKDGELDLDVYQKFLSNYKVKLVAITHVSNVLGTHNDIEFITAQAHKFGAKVLVDAAQSVAHQKVDVKKINVDFLAFSGHKLLGPTGIGVLYVKYSIAKNLEPVEFGGGMLKHQSDFSKVTWLDFPYNFEAGTPGIADAIALGSAIDYINENINFDELCKYEAFLCEKLINGLSRFSKITILGPIEQLKKRGHIVAFVINGIHVHDVAAYLDSYNICVRAGQHCAEPLHRSLSVESSLRVSFYAYNNEDEVEYFIQIIEKMLKALK